MAQAFIHNIIKLHGVPIAIVSDRDRIFTSNMWKDIFKAMKVELRYSSAYHPQSDGQTERVNQCLENYLRCMTFHEPKKWTSWLSLAEFWYNTAFHTSLQISPFQALYGFPPPQISELAIPGPADLDAQQFLEAKQAMLQQLKLSNWGHGLSENGTISFGSVWFSWSSQTPQQVLWSFSHLEHSGQYVLQVVAA